MKRKGAKDLINRVCLTSGDVTKEQEQALEEAMAELPYLENVCLRHRANGCSYEAVAKMLEISVPYVKYQERKAVRHLRAPRRYYSILLGADGYKSMLDKHEGSTLVSSCGFTTKTTNTLKRNGFSILKS